MTGLQDYLHENRDGILKDLRRFVELESPSTDKRLVDDFAEFVAEYAERMTGGSATLVRETSTGDHVRLECGRTAGRKPVFMVGHFDTVWPAGTIREMPFRVERDRAFGPGVFDMKAGLVQGLWAIRALRETGRPSPPIVMLLNADEEIGSPTSRRLIESSARDARLSMVLEPSFAGALKTARKGIGNFVIDITGRAAHAGSEPWRGVSAIDEAARLVQQLHSVNAGPADATVNVGLVSGGTRANVVAAQARLEVDVRVPTRADEDRITAFVTGLNPHHQEARVQITGGMNRPPMERTPEVSELFERARAMANELGFDLTEAAVGGGSDGNFCAAVNPAVLDGLGAVGDGAHALTEHVLIDHLVPRAALVACLLEREAAS